MKCCRSRPTEWNDLVEQFTRESTQGRSSGGIGTSSWGAEDRTYRYSLFPILFDDIETAYTGLVVLDISEQKKLQDQLIQSEKLSCLGNIRLRNGA